MLLVRTSTIIEVSNLAAVKQLLLQPLIDLVVDVAAPYSRTAPAADLRRELFE
jgi:hypothetical protein